MNIAYLILAHRYPDHIASLIEKTNYASNQYIIHVDRKINETPFLALKKYPNVILIADRINVKWGGFSFVEAILNMMTEAVQFKNIDYVATLSCQDYPIKSNEYICDFLTQNKGKQIIEISLYDEPKPNRISQFYFHDYYKKNMLLNIPFRLLTKILPGRNTKLNTFYWGRVWFFLTVDFCQYILDNRSFYDPIFKYVLLPDELYFHTILINSPWRNKYVDHRTMWADYYHPPHPLVLTELYFETLQNSDAFFARKFEPGVSDSLIKRIDSELLS